MANKDAVIFRHKKTGNIYHRLFYAVDATNERDGTAVVCYHREETLNQIFVREINEFYEKFEEVDGNQ